MLLHDHCGGIMQLIYTDTYLSASPVPIEDGTQRTKKTLFSEKNEGNSGPPGLNGACVPVDVPPPLRQELGHGNRVVPRLLEEFRI